MNQFLSFGQYSTKKIVPFILVIISYWLLIKLSNHFIAIDGVISLLSPAAGIGLVAILLGGYQFIPAIIIGSIFAYSPYHPLFFFEHTHLDAHLSIMSIILLSTINAFQAFIGAFLLKQYCDLSKGINSIKDFYLLWLLGGYTSALIGAVLCSITIYLTTDIILSFPIFKTTMLWWQGKALGIVLTSTILILLPAHSFKGWISTRVRLLELVLLFGITFISGQIIFLGWFPDTLGTLGRGYWIFLFISIAAIRFGKQGVVIMLLMTAIQAVYGAIEHIGFFAGDIERTSLSNLWSWIQIVALVGILQAIIIEEKHNEASSDYLTKLPNRRMFMTNLKNEIARAQRNGGMLGIIFIDLDRFKEVNDTLGHHIGDELLIAAANRLKNSVRSSDIISRLGGDEFTIIIPNIQKISNIDTIATKIITTMQEPFELAGKSTFISASAGISVYPNDSISMVDLLKFADQAMYSAKFNGKNNFHYFTEEMQNKVEMKNQLMEDLRKAINTDQLSMFYQPIVDVKSGKFVKAEALIRWNHPERGFVNPEIFIKVAEETGNMTILGDWITTTVLRQLAEWRHEYNTQIVMAINISPLQFMNSSANEKIRTTLKKLHIPYEQVILEITEGVLLDDNTDLFNEFKLFDDLNIKLAIDDFGTGYSSLSYIKKYPIHFLKIDRAFINDLEVNNNSKALVKAILAMSEALDMEVIAEGVETAEQYQILKDFDCDFIQGYFYSKPLPPAEFEKFLS